MSVARLVIDVWRNAYTLNYEAIQGANERVEPSIGHWMPTPPLFDLGLDELPTFSARDGQTAAALFANNGHTLKRTPTITIASQAGWFTVDDGHVYDVIRSADKLHVYSVVRPVRAS
jgi:hypothetical protein